MESQLLANMLDSQQIMNANSSMLDSQQQKLENQPSQLMDMSQMNSSMGGQNNLDQDDNHDLNEHDNENDHENDNDNNNSNGNNMQDENLNGQLNSEMGTMQSILKTLFL